MYTDHPPDHNLDHPLTTRTTQFFSSLEVGAEQKKIMPKPLLQYTTKSYLLEMQLEHQL